MKRISSGATARSRSMRSGPSPTKCMMRMLPGIVERDLDLFGSSINTIQGLGFKKVELSLQPPRRDRPPFRPARGRCRRGRHELVRPCGLCHRGHGDAGPRAGGPDIHGGRGLRGNDPCHHRPQPRGRCQGCVMESRKPSFYSNAGLLQGLNSYQDPPGNERFLNIVLTPPIPE